MYRSFTASTKFGVYMEPYITNDILGKLGVNSIFVLYTACIRPCIWRMRNFRVSGVYKIWCIHWSIYNQ